MSKIVTLTLNSAVENVVFAEKFEDGIAKNIIQDESFYTGKAVNSGLLLSNIGIECAMFIVSGKNTIESFKSFSNSKRDITLFPVNGNTRVNQTVVLNNGEEYKIINESYTIKAQQLKCIEDELLDFIDAGDYVLVAGSLPNGVSSDWYKNIILRLKKKCAKVFFDASGKALLEGVTASPYYIKPNQDEFSCFTDRNSIPELCESIKKLHSKYQISNIIVSLGPDGALGYNCELDKFVRVYSNEVFTKKAMTTGCGDSFNAGFIFGEKNNLGFVKSMIYGVACGGANVCAGFPEKITKQDIEKRLEFISYEFV